MAAEASGSESNGDDVVVVNFNDGDHNDDFQGNHHSSDSQTKPNKCGFCILSVSFLQKVTLSSPTKLVFPFFLFTSKQI